MGLSVRIKGRTFEFWDASRGSEPKVLHVDSSARRMVDWELPRSKTMKTWVKFRGLGCMMVQAFGLRAQDLRV